jgi:hypothetical protein
MPCSRVGQFCLEEEMLEEVNWELESRIGDTYDSVDLRHCSLLAREAD